MIDSQKLYDICVIGIHGFDIVARNRHRERFLEKDSSREYIDSYVVSNIIDIFNFILNPSIYIPTG